MRITVETIRRDARTMIEIKKTCSKTPNIRAKTKPMINNTTMSIEMIIRERLILLIVLLIDPVVDPGLSINRLLTY